MIVKVVATLLAVLSVANVSAAEPIVGAPIDGDMNDTETQKALQFAVEQVNAISDSVFISQVVKVIRVQIQIVAGVKYIFNVEMAKTCCKKTEAENTCAVNADPAVAQIHECKLEVLSRPGDTCMTLIENTC